MTSTNTYIQNYVVYHVTYFGNKLLPKNNSKITPSNYIGSTSIEQINKGYMGSVKSKKYKSTWKSELKVNPHLFYIEIISYHDTRSAAMYKELQVQKIFNVVKNPLFVNMSYASINGYFGRDVSGNNHPLYGIKGKNNPNYGKLRPDVSIRMRSRIVSQETKEKSSIASKGKPKSEQHKANKRKSYLCTKNDIQIIVKNMFDFCQINDLTPTLMYAVASGKRAHHKKWKCQKII